MTAPGGDLPVTESRRHSSRCRRGGRNVVRDVSLEIPAGEITALLGPNGAGKSSLVLAIGGVLKPVAGKVSLDDRTCAASARSESAGPGSRSFPRAAAAPAN